MTDVMQRLRLVQSWWLGSQLVRRHPELILIETHPGGGMYDCLSIVRYGRDGSGSTLVDLNREGSIHVHPENSNLMTWKDELQFGDRHAAVKRIEAAAGLIPPTQTPATTSAVLSYRAIASVLATLLNEREVWDARSYRSDSPYSNDPAFDVVPFPTAEKAVRASRPDDFLGDPGFRFWGLTKGGKVVAVVDTDGTVHLRKGRRSLVDAYTTGGRRLTKAIGAALGDVLP